MNAMFADAMACNARLALLGRPPEATNAELFRLVISLQNAVTRLQGRIEVLESREKRMEPDTKPNTLLDAVMRIAEIHRVPPSSLFLKSKARPIAWARFHVWHETHATQSHSWIARKFGVDHTTVMHGVKQWEAHGKAYLEAL